MEVVITNPEYISDREKDGAARCLRLASEERKRYTGNHGNHSRHCDELRSTGEPYLWEESNQMGEEGQSRKNTELSRQLIWQLNANDDGLCSKDQIQSDLGIALERQKSQV